MRGFTNVGLRLGNVEDCIIIRYQGKTEVLRNMEYCFYT